MKYFIEGWLHHKNHIAINLMKDCGLNIDFIYDNNTKYDCIINTDSLKDYKNHEGIVVYGPHIMFTEISDDTYFAPNKLFNSLSPWLENLIRKIKPNLNCISLPFAVDTNRFCPKEKNGKPIIYYKNVDKQRLYDVINNLNGDFIIFDYRAKYNEYDFLEAISTAPYAIWIGSHESQGFAFQETMSCNTPIFVINVKSLREEINSMWINYKPELNLEATTVSYFDDTCGMISYPETWKNDINLFLQNIVNYNPRAFIINNLSPKACNDIWNNTIQYYK